MNRRFFIDAAERVAWTAIEAAAGALIAAGVFDAKAGKAAAFAGLTAAAGLVKVTAAKFVGRPDSAAVLPAAADPAPLATGPLPVAATTTGLIRGNTLDEFEPTAPIKAHPKKPSPSAKKTAKKAK